MNDYEAAIGKNGLKTCLNIDECDTLDGNASRTENGKCKDQVLGYECEFDSGHESTQNENDICQLSTPGEVPFASYTNDESFFGQLVDYFCVDGYSVTAKKDSAKEFAVHCDADGRSQLRHDTP